MLILLKRLLGFCNHKWKIIKTGDIINENGGCIGKYYVLQCEHCGNIKKKDFC
jgi:hypothetical protein